MKRKRSQTVEPPPAMNHTQLISRTDMDKVTNMQPEQTPVKDLKTIETHQDARGVGEERRKTVKILDMTLAKESEVENLEGGRATPKRRNEILLEGVEYLSPAKKQKTKGEFNFSKIQKFWTQKEQKFKPSDFEITHNFYRGEELPQVKPQKKDSK